jgi:hypothetical protein
MGVKVRRNAAHVIVHPMLEPVVASDNVAQMSEKYDPNLLRGVRVVSLPDHHRYVALLALGHPAQVVLVEPFGHPLGPTQLTRWVVRLRG